MTEHVDDHHLSALSNVSLLLGDFPVRMVDGHSKSTVSIGVASLLSELEGDTVVVGLRLSPLRELVFACAGILGFKPGIQGGMGCFNRCIADAGWVAEEAIAVFPNLDSARFCFPVSDTDSHRFLVNEILYPRRYSLGHRTRVLLGIYRVLASVIPEPAFLYQATYVRMRRV